MKNYWDMDARERREYERDRPNAAQPQRKLEPWEDCNAAQLICYTAIQAAIRWCGLTDKETQILNARSDQSNYVHQGEFPQYPCLFKHSEEIRIAMATGTLRCGRDGHPVEAGDHVAEQRRTVDHADLKAWMRKNHPGDVQKQHMAWLFDDVERSVHSAITVDAYKALEAERDKLKLEIASLKQQAPRATQTDTDARLKLVCGLAEAAGLKVQSCTAADVRTLLERTGYAVSADTCERMLAAIRKRLPNWID